MLFNPRVHGRNTPWGVYEVIKVLPGNDEPEYHVKNVNKKHQRVARDSELTRA